MISFKNVIKKYPAHLIKKETIVLDKVSFDIKKGEFVLIVGKSGSGKTTLFKMILGEEKPTSGNIFFNDKDISKFNSNQIHIIRRKMGVIFQDYKLLSKKNIYENISYVMEGLGMSDDEIEKRIPELLDIVNLSSKAYHFPHELSGGEQQRAAIARALISDPEVILADEPTGNIDPYNTIEVVDLLVKINQKGTTVILATHDKNIINRLHKRVISLGEGGIVRDDPSGKFIL